jgi:hypothetical protein
MHWTLIADRRASKIAQGEFIEDELLAQLRDDKDMNRLGREFLKAVERGNAPAVGAYIEEGFPANYQDRQTQETALHISAAVKARKVLRVLLDWDSAISIAGQGGGSIGTSICSGRTRRRALLATKSANGQAQGIKLTRRRKRPLKTA